MSLTARRAKRIARWNRDEEGHKTHVVMIGPEGYYHPEKPAQPVPLAETGRYSQRMAERIRSGIRRYGCHLARVLTVEEAEKQENP